MQGNQFDRQLRQKLESFRPTGPSKADWQQLEQMLDQAGNNGYRPHGRTITRLLFVLMVASVGLFVDSADVARPPAALLGEATVQENPAAALLPQTPAKTSRSGTAALPPPLRPAESWAETRSTKKIAPAQASIGRQPETTALSRHTQNHPSGRSEIAYAEIALNPAANHRSLDGAEGPVGGVDPRVFDPKRETVGNDIAFYGRHVYPWMGFWANPAMTGIYDKAALTTINERTLNIQKPYNVLHTNSWVSAAEAKLGKVARLGAFHQRSTSKSHLITNSGVALAAAIIDSKQKGTLQVGFTGIWSTELLFTKNLYFREPSIAISSRDNLNGQKDYFNSSAGAWYRLHGLQIGVGVHNLFQPRMGRLDLGIRQHREYEFVMANEIPLAYGFAATVATGIHHTRTTSFGSAAGTLSYKGLVSLQAGLTNIWRTKGDGNAFASLYVRPCKHMEVFASTERYSHWRETGFRQQLYRGGLRLVL